MFNDFQTPNYDNFIKQLKTLIDKYNNTIEKLIANSSFEYNEIIKPMQELDEELSLFFTPLSHLNSVMNSDITQKAYEDSLPILSDFHTKLAHNKALFEKLQTIKTDTPEQQRVIDESLKEFRLSGVMLPAKTKKRLEEIDAKLSTLSNQFSQNLLDATNAFVLSIDNEEDVKGIPEASLALARKTKDGKTVYEFTLQMPSYIAYMTYGPNRLHRETLYRAYNTRAPKNARIIDEILSLRQEEAKLLGFDDYAQYALERRDASSPSEVIDFLEKIIEVASPYAIKETQQLKEFAKKLDGIDLLQSYDVGYYSEKLKKELFDFDETMTQEYFKKEDVLKGLLDLVSKLFDVKFHKINMELWDQSVEVYDIYENNTILARLYFDLEARAQKRGGAWMHDFETHFVDSHKNKHFASAFIVCNFMPSSLESPSLLRHDDVVTLFHEMGHALHHIFGSSEERALSGINGVAWDVVEFPSQFLENFAYQANVLRSFGYHYETKEAIPEWLLGKIEASKNFQAAMGILRQVEFSLFDIKLHLKPYKSDEIQALLDDIRKTTSLITPPSYNKFQHGFSHIFAGGYAAGYYSYKWAEVLSADAFFACIDEAGGFDAKKAKDYKTYILSQGSKRDMRELYNEWLGKEPELKSLISLYGLD
ncbi:MAG: M3 family metallopeptidase [Campylobacterales bacterium]|nr:M3 family metallopeptidase [Campylobacterales bacterium]